jgi:Prenyltransferase and squalene oxidase repeat
VIAALLLQAALASAAQSAGEGPRLAQPAPILSADDGRSSFSRAVGWMLSTQDAQGAWGHDKVGSLWELNYSKASFYAWQYAGNALCCQTLMVADETPQVLGALERGLDWLLKSPVAKRGSDWDIDSTWAALYGFQCMVQAASHPRYQSAAWQEKLRARGEELYAYLEEHQEPSGGWGYYEGAVTSRRPTWATSFATAGVVPFLIDAERLGWKIDAAVRARAVEYVRRCRLPSGAFAYDLTPIPRGMSGGGINDIKGSLGRIQIGHWALVRAGEKTITADRLRWGLEQFFEHHKFLDVAYQRPIPHEAYYANAGYFYFFGHYYAARVVAELPEAEQEAWHKRLRGEIAKVQRSDGSMADFIGSFYSWTYGTSFGALTLALGLYPERFHRPPAKPATK